LTADASAGQVIAFGDGGAAPVTPQCGKVLWQPGGTNLGQCGCTTPQCVSALLNNANGGADLIVDGTLAVTQIPNGVSLDMHGRGTIIGVSGESAPSYRTLEVLAGGVILNPVAFSNISLQCDSTVGNPCINYSWAAGQNLTLSNSQFQMSAGATGPGLSVPASGVFIFSLYNGSNVGWNEYGYSTNPFFNLGASVIMLLNVSGTLGWGNGIYPPMFAGSSASSTIIEYGDSTAYPQTFSGFSGTYDSYYYSTAAGIAGPWGGSNGAPYAWSATPTAIACGTGGTQTISAAQALTPGLTVTTGTLSSPCVLDFSTNAATGWFVVDVTGVGTISVQNLQFKNGTQTQSLSAIPAGGLVSVWTHGANHIAVN